MTCSGCETTVEKSVLSLEGVMEVEASHHDKLTTVKFDKTRVTAEEMIAKINEKGYEALDYKVKDDTE
jgi:mercuric ion transport protein